MSNAPEIPLTPGNTYPVGRMTLRIMAVGEGYVMARMKGCVPFVESEEAFRRRLVNCVKDITDKKI